MKALIYFNTIAILIFISIAVITNPTEHQHKEAVQNRFDFWYTQIRIAGLSSSDVRLEENITADSLKITNFVLFSISKFPKSSKYRNSDGEPQGAEPKEIGFGIFGHIFLSNEIDKEYELAMPNRSY